MRMRSVAGMLRHRSLTVARLALIALDPARLSRCRCRAGLSVTVLDRNGALLRAFTSADGRWRLPVDARRTSTRATSPC